MSKPRTTPVLLIPGAWPGSWIWSDTIDRLEARGCRAHTLTLSGLEPDMSEGEWSSIGLADHVADALDVAHSIGEPLTVVGHSYSGIVAGMVADQAPDVVVHTVIVAGFYPRHGRSLLDDWGSDADQRAAERDDIERAGMSWAPPPANGLAADPGLDAEQAVRLGERLIPHPGRTVLEPVSLSTPITEQIVTVVANVGDGDPRSTLPDDLAESDLDTWRFRSVRPGHWPMFSDPDRLVDALVEAASRAGDR